MITILVIYIIAIVFFLFLLTSKTTPLFTNNDDVLLRNIMNERISAENELVELNDKLLRAKEIYHANRDLTSSFRLNKQYKSRQIFDPYMAMKFTYDLLDKWDLL